MKSTTYQIKEVALKFLAEKNIEYVSIGVPKYEVGTQKTIDVPHWSVDYEYKVFDIEVAFIKIDDATQKIIFVLTKHGYEYVDGSDWDKREEDDDDAEDWNEDI